jgi:hypothetical protein
VRPGFSIGFSRVFIEKNRRGQGWEEVSTSVGKTASVRVTASVGVRVGRVGLAVCVAEGVSVAVLDGVAVGVGVALGARVALVVDDGSSVGLAVAGAGKMERSVEVGWTGISRGGWNGMYRACPV